MISRPMSRVLLCAAPSARAARSVRITRSRRPRRSGRYARNSTSFLAALSRMPSCLCALEICWKLGSFQKGYKYCYCSFE